MTDRTNSFWSIDLSMGKGVGPARRQTNIV